MKKETGFIIFLLLLVSNLVVAQNSENEKIKKNLLFIDIGGPGGYGSVNFGYQIKKINKLKFSSRVGLATYRLFDFNNNFNPDIIIPLGINVYFGSKSNIDFELGQTISSIVYAEKNNYQPRRRTRLNTNFFIGYRYQSKKGFLYKVGYAPLIENQKIFRHWASLTIGYNF